MYLLFIFTLDFLLLSGNVVSRDWNIRSTKTENSANNRHVDYDSRSFYLRNAEKMSSIYNNRTYRSEPPTKGKVRKQHYTYLFPNPQSFNNNNNKCNNNFDCTNLSLYCYYCFVLTSVLTYFWFFLLLC